MTPTQTKKVDLLADFGVSAQKTGALIVDEKAPRVADEKVSEVAYVTKAVRLIGREREQLPVLLLRDGSQNTTMPLSAVGAAIAGGVVTAPQVLALLGVPAEKQKTVLDAIKAACS